MLRLFLLILFTSCSFAIFDNENDSNIIFDVNDYLDQIPIYEIMNIEELADSCLENRLRFFIGMGIDFSTLNEDLLPVNSYDFGDYITPVGCCHAAFGFHRKYLDHGNSFYLQGFLNNTNWLMEHMNDENYLEYDFDWLHADSVFVEQGWISGMAQGEALAVFCMAYDLTGDVSFKNAADDIFSTLVTNTSNYWCVYVDENFYYWLEEFPNDDYCHILNGFLFAMWGLWDYYVITRDELALNLLEASIKSIIDNFEIWDCEGVDGSRYCTHRTNPDPTYHPIHLDQLTKYADYFEINEFCGIVDEFMD